MSKNYVGKGWAKKFDNGGMNISLSLDMAKLAELPKDKWGNVRVVASPRKEPDEKSRADWYVTEDEYHTQKLIGEPKEDDSPF